MLDATNIFAAASLAATGGWAIHGTFSATSSFWGPVTWRGARSGNQIALTFDDGPTPGGTDRVLDILGELRVPAAFFVIGRNAARWPDLICRMDEQRHIVGNHTYDHDHLGMFGGPRYWKDQLARTDKLLVGIIGKRPSLFRPSMGFTTWPIHHAARRGGQSVITWSARGRDGLGGETREILRRLANPARGGDILLLHDGIDPHLRGNRIPDRKATLDALPLLIDALREKGMQFARLDQLMGIPAYLDENAPLPSPAAQAEGGAGNHVG